MTEVLGRLLVYPPLVAITGALGAALLIWRICPTTERPAALRALARLGLCGALLLLLAEAGRALCQAWSAFGPDMSLDQVRSIAFESRWGRRWQWQPRAAALSAAGFGLALVGRTRTLGWLTATVGVLMMHAVLPLTGHAATSRIDGFAQSVHSGGAALWVGTLAFILGAPVSFLRRQRNRLLTAFAPIATVSVGCLLLGAVILSVRALPGLDTFLDSLRGSGSLWARWWALKTVLALAMFFLGAWNWRRLRAASGSGVSGPAATELGLGLCAFVATALLTSTAQLGME